nr:hypothetical protein [Deltaproteobacteria bacterium]
ELEFGTADIEFNIALTGIDDITSHSVHSVHHYQDTDIKLDHWLVDTLVVLDDGSFVIDLSKFDHVVPDTTPRDSVRA